MIVVRPVDVVVSFDTTGSMYPCLTQVRRRINEMVDKLFPKIPGLKVGIIAHGDYYDEGKTYVTRKLDLTRDRDRIFEFISKVPPTDGGDSEECYELVLHQARDFDWSTGAKALILIGDDVPHGPNYPWNFTHLDWRNEIQLLLRMGVNVYGVQALNRRHATPFYQEIAKVTGGYHLSLDQFATVTDMIMAICYQQADPDALADLQLRLVADGRMSRNLDTAFRTLLGHSRPVLFKETPQELEAVSPGRFQILHVDSDQSIREFVDDNGLLFRPGRGFYQFTKTETIQPRKEVVLRDNRSGDLYTGRRARELLGLPEGESQRGRPSVPAGYTAFVQSTSYNRKLIGGTEFLYEVDRSR